MKVEIVIRKEVEVKTILVDAGVLNFEDAIINGIQDTNGTLIPCRNGDRWQPAIDIETGRITNWEQGKTAEIYYKVCDDGVYSLVDSTGEVVYTQNCYVPEFLNSDRDGWSDYIDIKIDENGCIKDWPEEIDFDAFFANAL